MIFSDSQLIPRNADSGGTIKVHGRTHITGIELSQFGLSKDTNQIFGSSDEICATCIIVMDDDEGVERIRYRTGMHAPFYGQVTLAIGRDWSTDPDERRSTHSRWHGRICGLVIETNKNVHGPFSFWGQEKPGTCGYETWEVTIDKYLVDYLTENMITNSENIFMGFKTEPKKGIESQTIST